MGGAKKKSLAQAEKQQQIQTAKQDKAAQKTTKAKPTKTSEANLKSGEIGEDALKELAGIKALTPFSVATKFNVKMSVAKDMLQTLKKRKTIEQVAGGRGIKVYKLTGNP